MRTCKAAILKRVMAKVSDPTSCQVAGCHGHVTDFRLSVNKLSWVLTYIIGTRWSVWVERGKLFAPSNQQAAQAVSQAPASSSSITSSKPAQTPPSKYVVYKEIYYANGGIEKWDKKIHWEIVYDDIYDANEAAREMMLEYTEDFEEDENAGSHMKPYSGSAELTPWFYNDPLSVSVKVIEAASAQQVVGRKRSRIE